MFKVTEDIIYVLRMNGLQILKRLLPEEHRII